MNPRRFRSPLVLAVWLALLLLVTCTAQAGPGGPRDGKYRIFSYGAVGKPPLFLGSFVLEGGTYRAFLPGDRQTGEGRYSFNAAEQKVVWESGPYAGTWEGGFTAEGATHKIRLKRTTIATNTPE